MPTLTTNFGFQKPLVNNATDADLWGGQLNTNWDDIDVDLSQTTASKTNDFNVGATEFNYTYLIDASSNTVTVTLPAASGVFNGFTVRFKAVDATNTITIDGNGSETIDGEATKTLIESENLEIVCDGSNWTSVVTSPVKASQAEAEAGTSNDVFMTPLRTVQAIDANAPPSLGVNQTWQDVTASRTDGVTYTNNTGKPISVHIIVNTVGTTYDFLVDGVVVYTIGESIAFSGAIAYTITAIVPDGSTYEAESGMQIIQSWVELR